MEKTKNFVLASTIILACSFLLTGCIGNGEEEDVDEETAESLEDMDFSFDVDIRGIVERTSDISIFVEEDGYNHTLVLDVDKDVEDVEGDLESKYDDTEYSVAQISKGNAEVFKNGEKVDFDIIEEGMKVEVSFTGPIQESYPVQATAGIIQILEN